MNFDPIPRRCRTDTRSRELGSDNSTYAQLPGAHARSERCALLDTLGCRCLWLFTPWAQMLLAWARAGAQQTEATVWGEARAFLRTSDAALVNGTSSHAFELDDYHNAKLHPGAVVDSGRVAVAEKLDAPASALLPQSRADTK